jgi:hypothetical protein
MIDVGSKILIDGLVDGEFSPDGLFLPSNFLPTCLNSTWATFHST